MKCPYCKGAGDLSKPTLGACVLAARQAAGMTQEELAEKAAVSRSQIANIEADRSDVPLRTLMRIADGLGMSARDLIP